MSDIQNYIRKSLLSLKPYSSARDEFDTDANVFLDANENPFGELNRYPDPRQRILKQKVSAIKGVPENQIFIGNGSDEAIDLCFRIFCEPGSSKAATFVPTYGMYKVAAAINDVQLIEIPLDKAFQIDFEKTKVRLSGSEIRLLLLCSPNNPTGNSINEVEEIIREFKGIVIIDEAYIDFSDKPSWTNRLDEFPNLIVLQTFSKAFGLAAARVGMAFASAEIISWFDKVKPPYNVSFLNQNAAIAVLDDMDRVASEIRILKAERENLILKLSGFRQISMIFPSDANFILIVIEDAILVYGKLLEHGIVVRKRTSEIPNALRISIGTPSENSQFLQTLTQILS